MAERKLDVSDTTAAQLGRLQGGPGAAITAKRRKLVRMVEKRKGMCVWAGGDAVTLRVVLPGPADDRRSKISADQAGSTSAPLHLTALILQPGGVCRIGVATLRPNRLGLELTAG